MNTSPTLPAPVKTSHEYVGDARHCADEKGAGIHINSRLAYHETERQRATMEARILGLMADGEPRTDREIATELDLLQSQYRPRINELVAAGLLHEVGSKECPVTHKRVRLTRRFI